MQRGGPRALSATQQFLNLKSNPICAGDGGIKAQRLVWRFWARPTPLSRDYLIRIEFAEKSLPEIFAESPDLSELAGGRRVPHIYSDDPLRLCLYLPGTGEWQGHMRIDQTIVPWVFLWLGYFEEWLFSNDWKGGGMHPEDQSAGRRNKKALALART